MHPSEARPTADGFDTDWVVVGSGFGGSVSALRLAEKGYRVTVLERGEHFRGKAEMPKSSWDARRYLYAPRFGLRGLFRMTLFKDVFVMSGAGVGGGSLVYAMTLYTPPQAFFDDPQWAGLRDWPAELAPHYETAQRMLGVTDVTDDDPATSCCAATARRSASATRTARRGWGPTWRRRARPCPIPISAARARRGRAACAPAAACSGASTAPRTAPTRTTCGSRSATARRSVRAAR